MKKFSGEKMIIVAVTAAFLVLIGASVWKATDTDDLEKGSVTASPTENTQYDDSTESSSYDEDETEDFYVSTSTPTPTNYSYGSSKKDSSAKKSSSTKSSSKKSNPYKNYDEGYDDVYMDDDYDLDRYNKDRDYADGVDDAEEDEEEYGEDW